MIEYNNIPEYINETKSNKAIHKICFDYGYTLKSLTYVFMTDEELLDINIKYLNHDYYTDVITFDLSEKEKTMEGDIYISKDRVEENANDLSQETEIEMYRVMLHGVLHLVGLKDKTEEEEKEIRNKENEYLTLVK